MGRHTTTQTTPSTVRIRFERVLLWLEVAVFFVALFFYVYFILVTIVQIVLRQELLVSIQEAETHVSKLEATYFAQASTISPHMAQEYGLVAIEPSAYVTLVPSGERITRRTE